MSKPNFIEVDLGDFRAGIFHFQKTNKVARIKAVTQFNRTTFFDVHGNELGRQFKHKHTTQCQATKLLQPHIIEAQKEGVKFFLKEETARKVFSTRERMGIERPAKAALDESKAVEGRFMRQPAKIVGIESARQAT